MNVSRPSGCQPDIAADYPYNSVKRPPRAGNAVEQGNDMTEEDRKILEQLVHLNSRAKLVIADGTRDSVEPFWIVDEIGWHELTGQIVFRSGVRIDRDDVDFRERVKWMGEK